MPTTYKDQFYLLDPAAPPPVGSAVNFQRLSMVDQNDNGLINRFSNDSVNGSDITASWPGDTVTINVSGVGNVTYTGITFYTADGARYFTPTDGQVLQNGTFVSSTFVFTQGSLNVGNLGPTCFVTGTRIATAKGAVEVERLRKGDLIRTVDNGLKPLLGVLSETISGTGACAPVLIRKGALGNERDLKVSQQHRILVKGWRAELHFACAEVLVAAKHLVDGRHILIDPCAVVTYHHLLFERHELIFSEGLVSESYFVGPGNAPDDRNEAELKRIFGDLVTPGYQVLARPELRRFEGAILGSTGLS